MNQTTRTPRFAYIACPHAGVIVHAPPGSGKSRCQVLLRAAFKCTGVVDGWAPDMPEYAGQLMLTQECPTKLTRARVLSLSDAVVIARARMLLLGMLIMG